MKVMESECPQQHVPGEQEVPIRIVLPFKDQRSVNTVCKQLHDLRVRFFEKIRIRVFDPRSLGSWCIKGTDESTLGKDLSVPLMHP